MMRGANEPRNWCLAVWSCCGCGGEPWFLTIWRQSTAAGRWSSLSETDQLGGLFYQLSWKSVIAVWWWQIYNMWVFEKGHLLFNNFCPPIVIQKVNFWSQKKTWEQSKLNYGQRQEYLFKTIQLFGRAFNCVVIILSSSDRLKQIIPKMPNSVERLETIPTDVGPIFGWRNRTTRWATEFI